MTLANNTILDGGGRAIDYFTNKNDDIVPPDIDENTLSGNASNAIWVAGKIAESTTWEDRGYPIVLPGGFAQKIAAGVTLTLGPGLVVKLSQGPTSWVQVDGELIAEGTTENPITFTSIKDDSVGGDTNADGSATQPAAGDWRGFIFSPGTSNQGPGRASLDYVHARYGGAPASCGQCGGGGPMFDFSGPATGGPTSAASSVRHSKLEHTVRPAVFVSGDSWAGSAPTISHNRFRAISSYAIQKTGSQILVAPLNDFGCESGPLPFGCGVPVSNVDPRPWSSSQDENGRCHGKKAQCGKGGDPVSLASGTFTYEHTDLRLTNKSDTPLEFTRAYNSGDDSDSGLGPGWSHIGLIRAVELESGDVLVRRPDGRQDVFTETLDGYDPPSGVTDTLEKQADDTFKLTTLDRTVYEFDETGRIAQITDDHGLETTYGYNADGRLASITDPSGQTLTFTYNASNHITKVTDSAGREVSYTYTPAGDLDTVIDALGGVTDYDYDLQHRLTKITDPRGTAFLTNSYDSQGRINQQTDGSGNVWAFSYASGQTQVTDPEGGTKTFTFDSQDRVASESDQLSNVTSYAYDSAGNISEITRPGSAEWSFIYDAAGNLTQAIDPEGGQRDYSYDSQNRLTGYTDPLGKTWSYTWSAGNDLTKITDPDGKETTLTYNSAGQPLTITDPNSNTTTYTYDADGNLTSVENPLGQTTNFGYDAYNNLTSVDEPVKAAETYTRNALGDLLSMTTPEGNMTSYDYDANGMLTEITDPAAEIWTIERNAMERPTAFEDPLGNRTEIAYDGNLNPMQVTDRRGKVTTYDYDLANRLTEVDPPAGNPWSFAYDGRGNRTQLTDPRGYQTTYTYDLADRMTGVAEPLSTSTSYAYDDAGNLTQITDPRGNSTSLSYDDLGRLSAINQPLGKQTSFAYDPAGNLASRTTAAGTLALAYDDANRLIEIAQGTDVLREFVYDNAGRLTDATDAQGTTLQLDWDDDDRLTAIDDGLGQTVARSYDSRSNLTSQTDGRGTLSYVYDDLSRLTQLTDPQSDVVDFGYDAEGNLTSADLPNGITTTNAYDDAGRLTDTESVQGTMTLEHFAYAYDVAGNRTSATDRNGDVTTYSYDALNRLTQFDPPVDLPTTYTYDAAGNLIAAGATTHTYNALNQLTASSDGTTYAYDGAGRVIERANLTESTTYEWDLLDQLTEVEEPTQSVDYTYDALGRRSARTEATKPDNPAENLLGELPPIEEETTTAHYGDLTDNAILDTDDTGAITTSWVQGAPGLVEERSGGATAYPLSDAHGDVAAMTDAAAAVTSRHTYDPWGVPLSGPDLQMGFLGAYERRTDAATSLIQMGVRPYDPALGRFLSEDPVLGMISLGQSANRYGYGFANPINMYDLDGRFPNLPTTFPIPIPSLEISPSGIPITAPFPIDPILDLVDDLDPYAPFVPSNNRAIDSDKHGASCGPTSHITVAGALACAAMRISDDARTQIFDAATGCASGAVGINSAVPIPLPYIGRGLLTAAGCLGGAAISTQIGPTPVPPVYR